MGLTKRQSRVISVALLLSFFAGTVYLINSSKKEAPSTIPETGMSGTPAPGASTPGANDVATAVGDGNEGTFSVDLSDPNGAQMVLKNFKRNISKDGQIRMQIIADEGHYRPTDGGADLKKATIIQSRKDGSKVTLKADHALLFTTGQDLQKADMTGHVTVDKDDMHLATEKALYQQAEQKVHITAPVAITTDKLNANADTMDVDLAKNVALLKGNVVTLIKPKPTKTPEQAKQK